MVVFPEERLVSVDAKLSLGALDFSPLHHSLVIVHKTPTIISNSHVDDPSMVNFGKIWRMGWYLQSNKSDLDSMCDVESKSIGFKSSATMLPLYAFCDDLHDADVAELNDRVGVGKRE